MKPEWMDLLRTAIVVWSPRALIALAGTCVLAMVWLRIRHGSASRCPGALTPPSWSRPWTWFRRSACGYDLTGLPTSDDGSVRCPECGTGVPPGTCRWFRSSWRLEVIACLCAVVAGACAHGPFLHGGRWLAKLPTPVLLALESAHPTLWSRHGRSALADRLDRHQVSDWQASRLRAVAIAQLGEDDIPGNAEWALGILRNMREAAFPALEIALDDPDWQRRQMAAYLLRTRAPRGKYEEADDKPPARCEPSDRLLEVVVEGLRDDNLPYDRSRQRETYLSNGFDGMEFLARVGPRAAPACERALDSDDPQQRLLAAAALAMMGSTGSIERAAPILVSHLGDNGLSGDAHLAVAALPGFGPDVVSFVEPCLALDDRQCSELSSLVLTFVAGVPAPPESAARGIKPVPFNRWSTREDAVRSWRDAARWRADAWQGSSGRAGE